MEFDTSILGVCGICGNKDVVFKNPNPEEHDELDEMSGYWTECDLYLLPDHDSLDGLCDGSNTTPVALVGCE